MVKYDRIQFLDANALSEGHVAVVYYWVPCTYHFPLTKW